MTEDRTHPDATSGHGAPTGGGTTPSLFDLAPPATPAPATPAPAAPDATPDAIAPFQVEVVRSARRKRTVGAQMIGEVLRVTIPSWMSRSEEAHWVDTMTRRYRRARQTDRIDLRDRATTLARRYDLPRPTEVRWGGEMRSRWGSCTPGTGTIRVNDRLAAFPTWVLDYVLVHELAHLAVADHSPAFWEIVHRYPRTERAIGYLLAKSGDHPDTDLPDGDLLSGDGS